MGMVERVARALCAANGESPDGLSLLTSSGALRNWQRYETPARAAIGAMREPTEAQYEALCATDKMWRELDSKTVWQTYIDAVLREPT